MSRKLQYHQCKYGDGSKTQQQASYGLYFPATVWAKQAVSGYVIFTVLADHWRILQRQSEDSGFMTLSIT